MLNYCRLCQMVEVNYQQASAQLVQVLSERNDEKI